MKTTLYSLSQNDIANACKVFSIEISKESSCKPNANIGELKPAAKIKAIFSILESDGLVEIIKERDETFSFADHAGESFSHEANPDLNPINLKKDEKRERARFNRLGAFFYTLVVMGEDIDSIGGFVGNDFYGSGYDKDFYSKAIQKISTAYPDYYESLMEIDFTQPF